MAVVLPTDWNYTGSDEQRLALHNANLTGYSYPIHETPREPWWERGIRNVVPGSGAYEDYWVGLSRIATGTVGKGTNPTWGEAWDKTARDLPDAGLLPGGEPPADWTKDLGKGILTAALVVGGALVASRL